MTPTKSFTQTGSAEVDVMLAALFLSIIMFCSVNISQTRIEPKAQWETKGAWVRQSARDGFDHLEKIEIAFTDKTVVNIDVSNNTLGHVKKTNDTIGSLFAEHKEHTVSLVLAKPQSLPRTIQVDHAKGISQITTISLIFSACTVAPRHVIETVVFNGERSQSHELVFSDKSNESRGQIDIHIGRSISIDSPSYFKPLEEFIHEH
tara:strand:+ start:303 stop:917 length:615 start_codon:yes stop_codon:yes gene_type:complete